MEKRSEKGNESWDEVIIARTRSENRGEAKARGVTKKDCPIFGPKLRTVNNIRNSCHEQEQKREKVNVLEKRTVEGQFHD
jgi:hypothetical protein